MILSGIHSGTEALDSAGVGTLGDGTVGAGMAGAGTVGDGTDGDGINLSGAVDTLGTTGAGEATDLATTIDMEEGWRITTASTDEALHSLDAVV